MRDVHFDRPVIVEGHRPGLMITVSRTGRAAEMLLHGWNVKGPCYRKAVQAVTSPMNTRSDVSKARKAFAAAAREADIFIQEGQLNVS